MGNVLFNHAHERDKVKFFAAITSVLRKNKYNSIHLAFSREELSHYHKLQIQPVFMPKELKKISLNSKKIDGYNLSELISYTVKFNEANKYKISSKKLREIAIKYLLYLEGLERKSKISLIIIWNDTFIFDALAKAFAIKNHIPYRIFEAGLFRPNTITVDSVGVNANNSVPRDTNFFRNITFNSKELETEVPIDLRVSQSNISYICNRLVDFICTKLGQQEETRIIFEPLIKKVIRNVKKTTSNMPSVSMSKGYIFVPFQVKDDSQILQNSKYIKSMEDLVVFLVAEIREWNKNNGTSLKVVFKEHPADTVDYRGLYKKYSKEDHVIFLKKGNTQDLIKNSKLVVTINSTVGLEAISQYKRVITLGEAFYNIEGISFHCNNQKEFQYYLKQALSSDIDSDLVNNFLNYLKYEYQLIGNWREGKFNEKQMLKKLGLQDI